MPRLRSRDRYGYDRILEHAPDICGETRSSEGPQMKPSADEGRFSAYKSYKNNGGSERNRHHNRGWRHNSLVRGDLSGLVTAGKLSRATFRKIRRTYLGLLLQPGCHSLAILGLFHPIIAELGMAIQLHNRREQFKSLEEGEPRVLLHQGKLK